MDKLSIFRLPILWLFMGPPVLRLSERGAMASVQGSYDFWSIFQVAWWLFWGAVALRELYRSEAPLRALLRDAGALPWWTGLWLLAMYLSCLVSPAPLFSFANVTLLAVLTVCALDLGLKLYVGRVSVRRVLGLLLASAVALLLLVGVLCFVTPGVVIDHYGSMPSSGLRIRGGQIGYTPLLAIIAMLGGGYFFLEARASARWPYVFIMGLGLVFLMLGQTRSAYGGFVIALAVFVWRWGRMGRNAVHLMTGTAVAVVVLCAAILSYSWSGQAARAYDSTLEYIVREKETLSTMTGRTVVIEAVREEVARRPLGMGYSAGPRAFLQSDRFVRRVQSDAFGNAHNSYLEVFAGSGYVGFIAWMAIVLCVLNQARKMHRRELILVVALLIVVLLEGITESQLVVPFQQTAVTFWIAAAVALAYRARHAQSSRPSVRNPQPRDPHFRDPTPKGPPRPSDAFHAKTH